MRWPDRYHRTARDLKLVKEQASIGIELFRVTATKHFNTGNKRMMFQDEGLSNQMTAK